MLEVTEEFSAVLTESNLTAELPPLEYYCNPMDKQCPESFTTLVHTEETSGRFEHSVSWREASGLFDEFLSDRIRAAYALLDEEDGTTRESNFLNCHSLAYFARHKTTGEVKVISHKCGLRWCPACQSAKRAQISSEVAQWLKIFKHPKMLTLTRLHTDQPISDQISDLYKCFQNLKKRKFFKSKVTGGVWFFQLKRSKTDGRWHPHIHCLITGLFLPRDKLSKLWLEITGDSPVCDIRAIKDTDGAVSHTARYAASPADVSELSMPEIAEIIQAMHGRRIVGTWGLAKSISLSPKKASDTDSWVNVGSWKKVIRMRNFDDNAKRIFDSWRKSQPLPEHITLAILAQESNDFGGLSPPTPMNPYLPGLYN